MALPMNSSGLISAANAPMKHRVHIPAHVASFRSQVVVAGCDMRPAISSMMADSLLLSITIFAFVQEAEFLNTAQRIYALQS
jgi:hypothetical protein